MRQFYNKAIITGYYGMKNFGDDIFVYCGYEGLKRRNIEVKVLSGPLNSIDESVFLIKRPSSSSSVGLSGRFRRFGSKLNHFFSSDMVVYCGGSLFARRNLLRDFYDTVSKLNRGRLGAVSISIGPFSSIDNERRVERALKRFDFVSLRDKESYQLALGMNLPFKPSLSVDIAGTYPILTATSGRLVENEYSKTIGLAFCNESNKSEETQRQQRMFLDFACKYANEKRCKVLYFELNGHDTLGDLAFIKTVKDKVNREVKLVRYDEGFHKIIHKIRSCDLVFTSRLHGGIISYLYEVPFVLFEYHNKCTAFLDYIGYKIRFNPRQSYTEFASAVEESESSILELAMSSKRFQGIALENIDVMAGALNGTSI